MRAGGDDAGGFWLQRWFNRPTISAGERVWIVCEGMSCDAVVRLDDKKLGTIAADGPLWSRDITEQLTDRHQLTFELAQRSAEELPSKLPWREVRLEIRLHSTPDEDAA
jgi:hypothetical protein